jgi:hypothetical protein
VVASYTPGSLSGRVRRRTKTTRYPLPLLRRCGAAGGSDPPAAWRLADCGAVSLYYHVVNKDDLLDAMIDLVFSFSAEFDIGLDLILRGLVVLRL